MNADGSRDDGPKEHTGRLLENARRELGLSLEEAARRTGIPAGILEALENDVSHQAGRGLVLRSLKTVHKSAPPMPRRLWRSSPHPRLRFAIQLASSDPPRIVYLVAVGEIYPG